MIAVPLLASSSTMTSKSKAVIDQLATQLQTWWSGQLMRFPCKTSVRQKHFSWAYFFLVPWWVSPSRLIWDSLIESTVWQRRWKMLLKEGFNMSESFKIYQRSKIFTGGQLGLRSWSGSRYIWLLFERSWVQFLLQPLIFLISSIQSSQVLRSEYKVMWL